MSDQHAQKRTLVSPSFQYTPLHSLFVQLAKHTSLRYFLKTSPTPAPLSVFLSLWSFVFQNVSCNSSSAPRYVFVDVGG